jgi:hypothetical protein
MGEQRFGQLASEAYRVVVDVMAENAHKYDDEHWKEEPWHEHLLHAYDHLAEVEDIDMLGTTEGMMPHLEHALVRIAMTIVRLRSERDEGRVSSSGTPGEEV